MPFEKVVCTGGSGRLGRHVVDRLAKNACVTVLDLAPPRDAGNANVGYVRGDITDYEALKAAFRGHDAVVHLAAIPNPRSAPAAVTFNINVQGAWAVLQAAEDAGIKRVACRQHRGVRSASARCLCSSRDPRTKIRSRPR